MADSKAKTIRWFSGMFFLFLLLTTGRLLHAQIAAEMDTLLETSAINFTQASRFVLAAAGEYPTNEYAVDEYAAAFALARENGWLPKKAAPDNLVKLRELCFLVMNAFNMDGSFLYTLFPGPRYAFRELDYLRLIPGRRDPALRVSGEELLRMLDMVTATKGVEWIVETPPPAPVVQEEAATVEPPAVPESAAAIAEEAPPPDPTPVVPEEAAEAEPPAVPESAAAIAEETPPPAPAPVVQEEAAKERSGISLINIQFLPDSVKLTAREMSRLREIAATLSRHPEKKILVEGHTALAGSAQGRIRISTERALAAADFLIRMNAQWADRITVTGYGAERPLEHPSAEAGRVMNRRVEIILVEEPPAAPESAAIAVETPPPAPVAREEAAKERSGSRLINIQFLPDSVELTAREMGWLRKIAAILSRHPEKKILVEGHTARAGSAQGRIRISTERALAVADYLIRMNAQWADRITVTGYGAERPLEHLSAEAGREMNRRVEIILLDEAR